MQEAGNRCSFNHMVVCTYAFEDVHTRASSTVSQHFGTETKNDVANCLKGRSNSMLKQ